MKRRIFIWFCLSGGVLGLIGYSISGSFSPAGEAERFSPGPAQIGSPHAAQRGRGVRLRSMASPKFKSDGLQTLPNVLEEQQRHWERLEAATIAWEYRDGKHNIFFDEHQFLRDALDRDPQIVEHLCAFLQHVDGNFEDISSAENLMEKPPDAVLDRMAALDILEKIGQEAALARLEAVEATLVRFVSTPIRDDLGDVPKRLLVAEKFEALEILTSIDARLAHEVLLKLENVRLAEILMPAIERSI